MTLGNTNGNNKGKKYLKIKGGEIVSPENQTKYDSFSSWVNLNYLKIKKKVSSSSGYNTDIFNDTFVHIGNKILYGGLDISDYQSYFSRSYFTNHILHVSKKNNQVDISSIQDHFATTIDRTPDMLEMIDSVMRYVKRKYPHNQYTVFHTYFTQFGDKTTFRSLSKDLNVSTFTIHTTIKLILSDIRNNPSLRELYGYTK